MKMSTPIVKHSEALWKVETSRRSAIPLTKGRRATVQLPQRLTHGGSRKDTPRCIRGVHGRLAPDTAALLALGRAHGGPPAVGAGHARVQRGYLRGPAHELVARALAGGAPCEALEPEALGVVARLLGRVAARRRAARLHDATVRRLDAALGRGCVPKVVAAREDAGVPRRRRAAAALGGVPAGLERGPISHLVQHAPQGVLATRGRVVGPRVKVRRRERAAGARVDRDVRDIHVGKASQAPARALHHARQRRAPVHAVEAVRREPARVPDRDLAARERRLRPDVVLLRHEVVHEDRLRRRVLRDPVGEVKVRVVVHLRVVEHLAPRPQCAGEREGDKERRRNDEADGAEW